MTWSMMQPNKQTRRFPVLLSLFAVIAIYVVPFISQLNMQANGMSDMDMNPVMQHHNLPHPSKHKTMTLPLSINHLDTHGGDEGKITGKMTDAGSMDTAHDYPDKSMDDNVY